MDTFCLVVTTFTHKDQLYYVWAQKEEGIRGNSNLYIAGEPVRLAIPELEWEIRGFWVNEGPAVLIRNGRIFITYSASATDKNYCVGLLYADENAGLLDLRAGPNAKSLYCTLTSSAAFTAQATTASRLAKTVARTCWFTMRAPIPKMEATRCGTQTATPI